MLTSEEVGLSVGAALGFNFLAGTSVILGGIIATAMDLGRNVNGCILAFGGGTYIYLGASEALPYAFNLYKKIELQNFRAVKMHCPADC